MKHSKYLFLIAVLIFSFAQIASVLAGSEHNVSGWAWSENIGWISFNNTSGGGVTSYGVHICESDSDPLCPGLPAGALTGYAWSENIGWISFKRSDTGVPPAAPYNGAETYIAKVDFATKEVSGWARALATGGGWDGWIKLRGPNYGVWVDTGISPAEFRNWGWADNFPVIGWISFNRANCDANKDGFSDGVPAGCPAAGTPILNYKVVTSFSFNRAPSANNLPETVGNYCFSSQPPIFLSWQYSDPDNIPPGTDPQSAYQVQIDNNSNFSSVEVDSGKVISSSNSYAPPNLGYNTTYYWHVKVWDSKDKESIDWSSSTSFKTYTHRYPWPEFSWLPPSPSAKELVSFIDESVCWDADNKLYFCKEGSATYSWNFGDGSLLDSTKGDTSHTYDNVSPEGGYAVVLSITDDVGTCNTTHQLNVKFPLPEWKEVPPVSMIWKLLANINGIIKNFLGLIA